MVSSKSHFHYEIHDGPVLWASCVLEGTTAENDLIRVVGGDGGDGLGVGWDFVRKCRTPSQFFLRIKAVVDFLAQMMDRMPPEEADEILNTVLNYWPRMEQSLFRRWRSDSWTEPEEEEENA